MTGGTPPYEVSLMPDLLEVAIQFQDLTGAFYLYLDQQNHCTTSLFATMGNGVSIIQDIPRWAHSLGEEYGYGSVGIFQHPQRPRRHLWRVDGHGIWRSPGRNGGNWSGSVTRCHSA